MTQNDVINMLQKKKEIYFLYNGSLQLPFVRCHEESFLDYAEVYADEKMALERAKELSAATPNRLLRVIKVNGAQRIRVLSDCMSLGLDAVNFVAEDGSSFMMPLKALINRKEGAKDMSGHDLLINDTLQITLVYLAQELSLYRKPEDMDMKKLAPLDEEAMKNVREARFYVEMLPVPPREGDPENVTRYSPAKLMHKGLNKSLLPIFADMNEMMRNRKEGAKFSYNIMTFEDIVNKYMPISEFDGIMINPSGAGLAMMKARAQALLTDPRFTE